MTDILTTPLPRGLRMDKQKCKLLFPQALKEAGGIDNLIKALKKEVRSRKIRSADRNEMSWMKTSIRYLESGTYMT
jgi:hypothetical protein